MMVQCHPKHWPWVMFPRWDTAKLSPTHRAWLRGATDLTGSTWHLSVTSPASLRAPSLCNPTPTQLLRTSPSLPQHLPPRRERLAAPAWPQTAPAQPGTAGSRPAPQPSGRRGRADPPCTPGCARGTHHTPSLGTLRQCQGEQQRVQPPPNPARLYERPETGSHGGMVALPPLSPPTWLPCLLRLSPLG